MSPPASPSPSADPDLPVAPGAAPSKDGAPPAGAVRFADRVLACVAVLFAANAFFCLQLHRKPALLVGALVGLAAVLAVRLRAAPARRLQAALTLLPIVILLTAFEARMAWNRPRDGTAAARRGRPFDSRSLFEVVRDRRREDKAVQSYVIPRALLTHNVNAPRWADEMLARTIQPNWGVQVDGVQTLPLAGVSRRPTIFCNEGGYWAEYVSDEHGYRNPAGIWGSGSIDVAILGDSYSQGACVQPGDMTAAHVRRRYPKTLTFGMCANGPLMEYANLKEHVVDLRPRIVLWVYYANDLTDLEVESGSDLLRRYFEDDGFKQGLASKQGAVDAALDAYLNALGERASVFPPWLSAIGLNRSRTPLFLQDLIMREQHSSLSSVVRLDWTSEAITTRFLGFSYGQVAPDYARFKAIVGKASQVVRGWGGELYFVYLPDVYYLRRGSAPSPYREPVLRAVGDLGVPIIDVHAAFAALPSPEAMRPHYEAHFTEEGFKLVADVILERLAKDGL